jgi:hypothetical protein
MQATSNEIIGVVFELSLENYRLKQQLEIALGELKRIKLEEKKKADQYNETTDQPAKKEGEKNERLTTSQEN